MTLQEILNDFKGEITEYPETHAMWGSEQTYLFVVADKYMYKVSCQRLNQSLGYLLGSEFDPNAQYPIDPEPPRKAVDVIFELKNSGNAGFQISNTGNQFDVFAGVKKCIEMYLKDHPETEILYFSATEPSRVKLYTMFTKIFERQGWKTVIADLGIRSNFIMINKDLVNAENQ
jgi:hypothetical protein